MSIQADYVVGPDEEGTGVGDGKHDAGIAGTGREVRRGGDTTSEHHVRELRDEVVDDGGLHALDGRGDGQRVGLDGSGSTAGDGDDDRGHGVASLVTSGVTLTLPSKTRCT
jgi:hypothetical protein